VLAVSAGREPQRIADVMKAAEADEVCGHSRIGADLVDGLVDVGGDVKAVEHVEGSRFPRGRAQFARSSRPATASCYRLIAAP